MNQSPWQTLFKGELFDLGTSDPRWEGIYSAVKDPTSIEKFIHEQFLNSAEVYARRYSGVEYFQTLICQSFDQLGWNSERLSDLNVLDIGSGAGNSIIPLLRLCKNSEVIASDLSVPLLAILKKSLQEQNLATHCKLVQMNAEELDFHPNSFDLVLGAAILHHLFSPQKVIQACARILKPHGVAIFYEPFENGNAMMKVIYRTLLEHPRGWLIRPGLRRFFKEMKDGLHLLKGRDKSGEIFQRLDDKWLFTKEYFKELGKQSGFTQTQIYPIHGFENMFEVQVKSHLRLGRDTGPERLCGWAWEKIRQFDQDFSEDMKKDLLIEGCIMFRK